MPADVEASTSASCPPSPLAVAHAPARAAIASKLPVAKTSLIISILCAKLEWAVSTSDAMRTRETSGPRLSRQKTRGRSRHGSRVDHPTPKKVIAWPLARHQGLEMHDMYKSGNRLVWAMAWLTLTACGSTVTTAFDDDGSGGDGQGGDAQTGGSGSGLNGSGGTGTGADGSGGAGTGATGTGATGTGADGSGGSGTGAFGGGPGTGGAGAFGGGPGTGGAGAFGGGPGTGFCHDVCEEGPPMDPFCEPCTAEVCNMDPFCCDSGWDDLCVQEAQDLCGAQCFGPACGTCGDALQGADSGELCPGSELLLEDLGICVCQTSCAMQCANTCQGGGVDQTCQDCITVDCDAELSACLQDGG